jgi:hypothetical protein
MAECVNLPVDLHCLSLTRSLYTDKFGFTDLSVGLRKEAVIPR